MLWTGLPDFVSLVRRTCDSRNIPKCICVHCRRQMHSTHGCFKHICFPTISRLAAASRKRNHPSRPHICKYNSWIDQNLSMFSLLSKSMQIIFLYSISLFPLGVRGWWCLSSLQRKGLRCCSTHLAVWSPGTVSSVVGNAVW